MKNFCLCGTTPLTLWRKLSGKQFYLRLHRFWCVSFYIPFLTWYLCIIEKLIEQPWLNFNYECPNLILFIKIFQSTFRDDLHEFCFYKFPECEIAYMICISLLFFNILCHHVIQLMFLINVYIIFSFYLFKLGHVLPMIIKGYLKKIGGNSSSIICYLSIFRFWH